MFNEGNGNEDTDSRRNSTQWLGYTLAFTLAVGAFASGLQIGEAGPASSQTGLLYNLFNSEPEVVEPVVDARPDLEDFWEIWDLLEEKYVSASTTQEVSTAERIQGAIDGLVDTYDDPYTVYLPPVDADQFDEDISGEFSGVGMEVGLRDDLVTIISPLPNTPAEAAGLIAGDVIIRIDDVSTEDMRLDQAVQMIRGEKGTVVTLTIFREGESEFLEIPVTRDSIEIPTVKTELVGTVFIIELYSFNAIAETKVREGLSEYINSGAETLVIDVRGNPGGFLQGAVSIASYFLPSGKVVVTEQVGSEEGRDFRTRSRQIKDFNPENLVVLVDNGSASASEILAGALQDHEVATIIGSRTFGKGSVQELVDLDDGSSLKVTVARWLTPDGRSISDGGLEPDIVISRTPAERLEDIDPQREAAIRFLTGEEVVSETFESEVVEQSEN